MKYKIIGKEIDNYAKNVNDLIDYQFNDIINEIKSFVNNTKWNGPAKESFNQRYENVIKEINKIPYFVSIYTDFLYATINNYGETLDEIKKKLQEIDKDINFKESKNG